VLVMCSGSISPQDTNSSHNRLTGTRRVMTCVSDTDMCEDTHTAVGSEGREGSEGDVTDAHNECE
jgi:hypothetical protein